MRRNTLPMWNTRGRLALLAVAVFASTTLARAAVNEPMLVGVSMHVIGRGQDQGRAFDQAVRAGARSVREDVPWKFVETQKGQLQIPSQWDDFVDTAVARGIEPVLILDYGNRFYDGGDKPRSKEAVDGFVRYASFVVRHFAGRVKYYEIWNEWDNTTGGFPAASPADYARLFNATVPALKHIDPGALVILGSGIQKPQYYEALAQLGVVGRSDGISIHPYNYDPVLAPEVCADFLIQLEKTLIKLTGHSSIDIYVTEIGWPTHQGHGAYQEPRVADFAYRTTMLLAALPFVKGMWWYDLRDDGANPTDKENHFGLMSYEWSPKPALRTYAAAASFVRTHQLSLSDRSNLKVGRVVLDVSSQNAPNGFLVWNTRNSKPALRIRCRPNERPDVVLSDDNIADLVITEPTLVTLNDGVCNARPAPPSSVNVQ